MNTKNLIIGFVVLLVVITGGVFLFGQNTTQDTMMEKDDDAMMQTSEETASDAMMAEGYTGELIAGSTTPYLNFTKADYDKALGEGKVVVLNFFANWCPVCRAEASDVEQGFNQLDLPNVVAFRVNYNDDQTDSDEEALAGQFNVPYQHTKIILKDGQEVYKETVQWSAEDVVSEVSKHAN